MSLATFLDVSIRCISTRGASKSRAVSTLFPDICSKIPLREDPHPPSLELSGSSSSTNSSSSSQRGISPSSGKYAALASANARESSATAASMLSMLPAPVSFERLSRANADLVIFAFPSCQTRCSFPFFFVAVCLRFALSFDSSSASASSPCASPSSIAAFLPRASDLLRRAWNAGSNTVLSGANTVGGAAAALPWSTRPTCTCTCTCDAVALS
mmetsp:Transcript_1116/g.2033  ORF Transcript_1116/g.2033 Transcript_1116/m.2033 type:complete len:214 (+) Transcript_1116:241-882(+)